MVFLWLIEKILHPAVRIINGCDAGKRNIVAFLGGAAERFRKRAFRFFTLGIRMRRRLFVPFCPINVRNYHYCVHHKNT